jgi:hypothetical protein
MKKYKELLFGIARKVSMTVYIVMAVRIVAAVAYRIYCLNRVNENEPTDD